MWPSAPSVTREALYWYRNFKTRHICSGRLADQLKVSLSAVELIQWEWPYFAMGCLEFLALGNRSVSISCLSSLTTMPVKEALMRLIEFEPD